MAELNRFRVEWNGFAGAPGVTTFYSKGTDVNVVCDAIDAWVTTLCGYIVAGIALTVKGSGDIIDEASGALTGAWQSDPDRTHTATATGGSWAAPVGALVKWQTSTIVRRRRLQGHTFLVPLTGANYQDGKILPASVTGLTNAANTLISAAANQLVVYSRPGGAGPGTSGVVTTASVPQKVAVLRSRRD